VSLSNIGAKFQRFGACFQYNLTSTKTNSHTHMTEISPHTEVPLCHFQFSNHAVSEDRDTLTLPTSIIIVFVITRRLRLYPAPLRGHGYWCTLHYYIISKYINYMETDMTRLPRQLSVGSVINSNKSLVVLSMSRLPS